MSISPLLYKLAEEVKDEKKKENPFAKKNGDKPKNDDKKNGDKPFPEKKQDASEEQGESGEEQGEQQEAQQNGGQEMQQGGQPAATGAVNPIAVMDFLGSGGPIDDAAFHSFAEQNGMDVHQAEAVAYKLAQRFVSFLRGGKSQGMDMSSIDPQQLEMGMKIEAEHADDPIIQKKVACDHLAENPQYYSQDVFQKELNKEHGGDQPQDQVQPQEDGQQKTSAYRGQGACGGKRKFDGSGKGVGKLKKAVMTKTAKKNLAPFLSTLMKQLKKQSPTMAKKNMANVSRAIKYPGRPISK